MYATRVDHRGEFAPGGTTDAGTGDCAFSGTFGADTIVLTSGTYFLSLQGAGEDAAATGDLDVTDSLTIQGVDGLTIIDGSAVEGVFHVVAGSLTLQGVTLVGDGTVAPVPEPAALLLLTVGGGMMGLGWLRRRMR